MDMTLGGSVDINNPDPRGHPQVGSSATWIFRDDCSKKDEPFLPGSQSPALSELKESTTICGLIMPM